MKAKPTPRIDERQLATLEELVRAWESYTDANYQGENASSAKASRDRLIEKAIKYGIDVALGIDFKDFDVLERELRIERKALSK